MNENHLKEFYDLTQQMTLLQLQTLNISNEVKVETRESGCRKQQMSTVSCKIMAIFFSLLLMATGGNSFGQHTLVCLSLLVYMERISKLWVRTRGIGLWTLLSISQKTPLHQQWMKSAFKVLIVENVQPFDLLSLRRNSLIDTHIKLYSIGQTLHIAYPSS